MDAQACPAYKAVEKNKELRAFSETREQRDHARLGGAAGHTDYDYWT